MTDETKAEETTIPADLKDFLHAGGGEGDLWLPGAVEFQLPPLEQQTPPRMETPEGWTRYELPGGYFVLVSGSNLRPDMVSVHLFDCNDNCIPVHVPLLGDYKPSDIVAAVQEKLAGLRKHMADLQKVVVAMSDLVAMQNENNLGQRRLDIVTQKYNGLIQLNDKATDNHDTVAVVPLTLDDTYDAEVVHPWAELFARAPEMQACLAAVELRLFAAAAEGLAAKEANELSAMVSVALGTVPF